MVRRRFPIPYLFARFPAMPDIQDSSTPVIETRGLAVRFRRTVALDGLDLSIPSGRVFALLGENGAGKTTLIRTLTGFQKPQRGQCRVLGMDPQKDRLRLRQSIGYVSDQPPLYDWMRIDEIGAFVAAFHPPGFVKNYRQAIQKYELSPRQKIGSLSKGQRAKIALSLALAHDPKLLILDEPTSGLDPVVRREFFESMIDRAVAGRSVFLSSHQIHEVERVADDIAILHRGKLRLHGPMEQIKHSVTEVTVSVDDPLTALPPLTGAENESGQPDEGQEVWSEQTSGRMRRIIVHHLDPARLEPLRQRSGVVSVRTRTLSLEELFVAATHGLPDLNDQRQPPENLAVANSNATLNPQRDHAEEPVEVRG